MTWRPEHLTVDDRTRISRNAGFRWSQDLQGKAWYGLNPTRLRAIPEIAAVLIPGLILAEDTQANAHALGSLGTFWVLDPNDEDVGIWGANVISNDDMKAAQDQGYPMAVGFYVRIGRIPPYQAMVAVLAAAQPGNFQPGFKGVLDGYYGPKTPTGGTKPGARVFPPAYELTVFGDGKQILAAKTADESATEDGPHPGQSAAGPGVWEQDVPGGSAPSSYGLPRPLVAYDEGTGNFGPAKDEYASVKDAAAKGDPGARQALDYLGLKY